MKELINKELNKLKSEFRNYIFKQVQFEDQRLRETYASKWVEIMFQSTRKKLSSNKEVYIIEAEIGSSLYKIMFDINHIRDMIEKDNLKLSYLSKEFTLKNCLISNPNLDDSIDYGDKPILICPFPTDKNLIVIDGNHRLRKAMLKDENVRIVLIDEIKMCKRTNFIDDLSWKLYALICEMNIFKGKLENKSVDESILFIKSFIFTEKLEYSILDNFKRK